jgi:hypothetical protein
MNGIIYVERRVGLTHVAPSNRADDDKRPHERNRHSSSRVMLC